MPQRRAVDNCPISFGLGMRREIIYYHVIGVGLEFNSFSCLALTQWQSHQNSC